MTSAKTNETTKQTCTKETILWSGLYDQVSKLLHLWFKRKLKVQIGPPCNLYFIGYPRPHCLKQKTKTKKKRESRGNFQYFSEISECGF